jgi:hypothetical protein
VADAPLAKPKPAAAFGTAAGKLKQPAGAAAAVEKLKPAAAPGMAGAFGAGVAGAAAVAGAKLKGAADADVELYRDGVAKAGAKLKAEGEIALFVAGVNANAGPDGATGGATPKEKPGGWPLAEVLAE